MLIIQHIETTWTKKSRGMPQAALRNAVPKTHPLPYIPLANNSDFVHQIDCMESNDFTLKERAYDANQLKRYQFLAFESTLHNNNIDIYCDYDSSHLGLPNRGNYLRKIASLAAGESVTLHINGRFSRDSIWYVQHYFNIANAPRVDEHLFTTQKTTYFLNQLEDLL